MHILSALFILIMGFLSSKTTLSFIFPGIRSPYRTMASLRPDIDFSKASNEVRTLFSEISDIISQTGFKATFERYSKM